MTFGRGKETKTPTAQTVARWILDTISEAGEGKAGRVTTHFTQRASISAAKHKGVCIKDIFKTADWSSGCVFAQHYLKEHHAREAVFCNTVLRPSQYLSDFGDLQPPQYRYCFGIFLLGIFPAGK